MTDHGVGAAVATCVAVALVAGCSSGGGPASAPTAPPSVAGSASAAPTLVADAPSSDGPAASTRPSASTAPFSLAGRVFVIDPGHNGGNAAHPAAINRQVAIVNGHKACDTTGTETDDGYPEYAFTLDVARRAAAILRARGATVVLTRTSSAGVGPCITQRAAIGNRAHADAAISIHADGGPASGYGFHVIEPGAVGPNDAIVAPSRLLGRDVRDAFRRGTGEAYSTYAGSEALVTRTDLGGLNLSTVPKVFIECANMRNAADAVRLRSVAFRQRAAASIAAGLATFARTSG